MLLHFLGKSKHVKLALKWTKNAKTVHDIIVSNLEKDDDILIVFGMNIFDTAGHQVAIQILSSPNICFCVIWKSRTNAT